MFPYVPKEVYVLAYPDFFVVSADLLEDRLAAELSGALCHSRKASQGTPSEEVKPDRTTPRLIINFNGAADAPGVVHGFVYGGEEGVRHVDVCIDEHEQVPRSVARAGVARSPYVLDGLMDNGCSVGPSDIDGQIRAVIVYNYRFHFYASVCA